MICDHHVMRITERTGGTSWLATWYAFRRDNADVDLGYVRDSIERRGFALVGGGASPEVHIERSSWIER